MNFLCSIVPKRLQNLSLYMDFDGQKRAEKIFQTTILVFALVGFVWGWICQHFSQTVYILLAGFILSCLLTLPPWPMYRKKPLNWQPAMYPDEQTDKEMTEHSTGSSPTTVPAQTKNKKKK